MEEGFRCEFLQHGSLRTFILLFHQILLTNPQTQAALPALRTTKGKIVFTSSQAAVVGFPNWGLYSATKAAANSLARNIANEEKDITSVCIDPGLVDTGMQRELREDHPKTLTPDMHALLTGVHDNGGLSRPEQPGHVIAKLVLDAPSEISGQFLTYV